MGDLLGIADTKAAIYDALPADGVAVINADDAFAPFFAERAHGRRLLRFGLDADADVGARDLRFADDGMHFTLVTPDGEADAMVPMPGRHNRSEEHTSELQSLMRNSYAVFCLKKKKKKTT